MLPLYSLGSKISYPYYMSILLKVVGTANAIVGGWGNLGGGAVFLLMPGLFELVKAAGAHEFLAWKIAVLIPALIVIGLGVYLYF